MAKKLKETDGHTDIRTYGRTYGLPLVVLSAALQQKLWMRNFGLALLHTLAKFKRKLKIIFTAFTLLTDLPWWIRDWSVVWWAA